MKQTHTRILFQSICLLALAGALNVQAANAIKQDTTSLAAVSGNWVPVPAATDIGEFDSTATPASLAGLSLGGADLTLGGLKFDGTMQGPVFVATGNNLILGASGIDMSAANQSVTFTNAVSLSSAQSWNVGSPQTLTVIGPVAITNLLTINGTGAVTFGATANTGTNGVSINGGTVTFGASASAGTGIITLAGGSLVMPVASENIANAINVTGTAGMITNAGTAAMNPNGVNVQLSGNITGSGTLNFSESGAGSLGDTITFGSGAGILGGFTGTVKVSDTQVYGFIRFSVCSGSTAATFDLGNGNIMLHTRTGQTSYLGALKGGPGTTLSGPRANTGTDTWVIGANGLSTTFYGLILNNLSGSNGTNGSPTVVNITKVGSGTLTLAGADLYSGSTIIDAGTLALSGTGTLNGAWMSLTNFSSPISVCSNATFDVSGLTSTFTLVSGQMLSNGAAATGIINGSVIAGTNSTIALSYGVGKPALTMAGGVLTLSSNMIFRVNCTNGLLAGGSYKLISSTGGTVSADASGVLPAVTVTGNSYAAGTNTLYISGGQLYLLVNPVAENFALVAGVGTPVTVPVIPKFAMSGNGDKLTLTIASAATNTAGSAVVDGTGSNIIYTVTGTPSGPGDYFTYTVTDPSANNVAATGKVTVTINQTGQSYNSLTAPVVLGNGNVAMSFAGIPGDKYALDWTHSLTPPVTWLPLVTNTAAANGLLFYTNTPSGGNDFYRTRYTP